jgi:hypothetical protein
MNATMKWLLGKVTGAGASTPPPPESVVTGNGPDDKQSREVRDRYFSRTDENRKPESESNLSDRMQSGGG